MTYKCGLDFGTSNSAISITDTRTKQNVMIESDSSILYFANSRELSYAVGKEAIHEYVCSGMEGRLLKSVKTLLKQKDFQHTNIFGRKHTPSDLASYIITHLKQKAEAFLNHEIDEVVLGRPVIFSEDPEKEKIAVDRLIKAATNAGFKDIELLYEPIAAAFSYEVTLDKHERVLVADFGGGTSDFTVMDLGPDRIHAKDRKQDIIANGGVYIGGDLFDSETMWHKVTPLLGRGSKYQSYGKELEIPLAIHWELKKWERSFLLKESKLRRDLNNFYRSSGNNKRIHDLMTLIDHNLVYSLFQQIEKSKIDLSSCEETFVAFKNQTIDIKESMSLTEFSSFLKKEMETIEQYLISLLDKANLTPNDIDTVFLTGGSSSVVPINWLFERIFGKHKIRTGNNFNSIALGLSL
ncbi:MAG: Hsp70 family protein [Bacteroidota bacterium]|nr:Hsp70 family protein [Bacteroidota bacterium]